MRKKHYLIINGPNLNLLSVREPHIYGSESFERFFYRVIAPLQEQGIFVDMYQSNSEGDIIDQLHKTLSSEHAVDGVILNAGAYTHTSLAIADAIAAINTPVVEVHISHIFRREEIRRTSLIAPVCRGLISGFGLNSYLLAIHALEEIMEN